MSKENSVCRNLAGPYRITPDYRHALTDYFVTMVTVSSGTTVTLCSRNPQRVWLEFASDAPVLVFPEYKDVPGSPTLATAANVCKCSPAKYTRREMGTAICQEWKVSAGMSSAVVQVIDVYEVPPPRGQYAIRKARVYDCRCDGESDHQRQPT